MCDGQHSAGMPAGCSTSGCTSKSATLCESDFFNEYDLLLRSAWDLNHKDKSRFSFLSVSENYLA